MFECALDNPNQYEPCGRGNTGSFQRNDLPDGRHSLYVRGIDDVGNVGLPSVYTVTTGMEMYRYCFNTFDCVSKMMGASTA